MKLNFGESGSRMQDDTGVIYGFIPSPYDSEQFQLGLMINPDKGSFQIRFKVYEEDKKAKLQIVDSLYEIKRIDGRTVPATMILIDNLNKEINFTEDK